MDDQIIGNSTQFEVLALTIIGEARGERIDGQVAVGCVIRNRLQKKAHKYHSYKDVCLEPLQFSCWNSDDVNRPFLLELVESIVKGERIQDPHIRQCMVVARGIEDWSIIDITSGSTHYLENNLFNHHRPQWAMKTGSFIRIGRHTFFNVLDED